MEGGFKNYVNQYNVNAIALNKPQRNEERDKKRHLSHKFSLTPASDFKWAGLTNGTDATVLSNLKQTIITYEQAIAPQYLHSNWIKIKKMWTNALNAASCYQDIANLLIIFQACLKTCVFANVWYEQLGHIKLYRITSLEREERKKIEKREKREKDDEEERFRLFGNFVKYTLGLRHQVWKQKGEEYRIHGQLGWLWVSASRKQHTQPSFVAAKPKEIVMPVNMGEESYTINVQPISHDYLHQVLNTERSSQIDLVKDLSVKELPSVEYINVSNALRSENRVFYPKVGRASKLNDLLERREKLKDLEEKNQLPPLHKPKVAEAAPLPLQKKNKLEDVERILLKIIKNGSRGAEHSGLNGHGNTNNNTIAKQIQVLKVRYTELQRLAKQYTCYVKGCTVNTSIPAPEASPCYSPLCVQRVKIKNNLLTLLKQSQVGGSLPKEILNILSSSDKNPTILESRLTDNDSSTTSIAADIKKGLENKKPLNIDELLEKITEIDPGVKSLDLIKIKAEKEAKTESKSDEKLKQSIVKDEKSEWDATNSNDSKTEEIKNEKSDSQDSPQLLFTKTPRSTRGRPPKIPRLAQNGPPVEDVVPETKPDDLKYNRRFPKILLPAKATVKKEEVEEYGSFPDYRKRLFSTSNTKLKINLRRIDPIDSNVQYKYPVPPHFQITPYLKSLLLLPKFELQKLARIGGKMFPFGFHAGAKTNSTVWPYPCLRPLFKTCWIYRTLTQKSLAAMALQLRIIWTCMRWDDMASKPANPDGKHQITTETEIVSLEILKHRYVGKCMERMQYLRRKVVIPLELPKTVRSVETSTRLGLRKRKRAESPQHTEPQVTEEWIDEDKLELWEVKQYGER